MEPTTVAPSRPSSDREIHCPLCGYNLRGLTEPRCPECGYLFDWEELLDAAETRHRYLFEQGRRGNVRSFLGTYFRTCLPRQFWKELKPTHTVRPRRLLVYFLLTALLSFLPMIGLLAEPAWNQYKKSTWMRRQFQLVPGRTDVVSLGRRFIPGSASPTTLPMIYRTWYQVDTAYPLPQHWRFWEVVWRNSNQRDWRHGAARFPVTAFAVTSLLLIWPTLTLGSACIFAWSMRRAKVRQVHVIRAAIYSADCGVLVIVCGSVLYWFDPSINFASIITILAGCLAISTWYRLWLANSRYLQLHRPCATAFVTQLISFLLICLGVICLLGLNRVA